MLRKDFQIHLDEEHNIKEEEAKNDAKMSFIAKDQVEPPDDMTCVCNDCRKQMMKKDLIHHIENECEEGICECPINGCKVKRKVLESHNCMKCLRDEADGMRHRQIEFEKLLSVAFDEVKSLKYKLAKVARGKNIRGSRNTNKDPNAPKRNSCSFLHYLHERRQNLLRDNPQLTRNEAFKLIGMEWKALENDTKMKYVQIAEEDKSRYEREVCEYMGGGTPSMYMPLEENIIELTKRRIRNGFL